MVEAVTGEYNAPQSTSRLNRPGSPHRSNCEVSVMQLPLEDMARDRSIAQGLDAAKEAWKQEAHAVVEGLATRGSSFTADDVTDVMVHKTQDLRALGGIFNGARAKGLIKHTGYQKSRRAGCHSTMRSVWKGT